MEQAINELYEKVQNCPKAYHVGDDITVAGEQYYVITDSPRNLDYVVALKATPLTSIEITSTGNTPGHTWSDNSGGMVYGPNSKYATSNVKQVLDNWAIAKFINYELKVVNGYSVRLITKDELIDNLLYVQHPTWTTYFEPDAIRTPNFIYNKVYWYWTMTPYNDSSSYLWVVNDRGGLLRDNSVGNRGGAIRPVINVYKSAIESVTRS